MEGAWRNLRFFGVTSISDSGFGLTWLAASAAAPAAAALPGV